MMKGPSCPLIINHGVQTILTKLSEIKARQIILRLRWQREPTGARSLVKIFQTAGVKNQDFPDVVGLQKFLPTSARW